MKELTESDLNNLYNKFIKNKFFYRAVSREYLSDIKKKGLTPERRPFDYFKKELRQFLNIIDYLDKKEYGINYKWYDEPVQTSKLLRVLRKDLKKKYIDLSPNLEDHKYYLKRKGGSLVTTFIELIELIEKKNYPLNKKQEKILKKVKGWCQKRASFSMASLKILRTSKYLEKAHFQHFGGKYWPSPFGSFEHFKKVIKKEGIDKYLPRFEDKQKFYIRLSKKVPAREIIF